MKRIVVMLCSAMVLVAGCAVDDSDPYMEEDSATTESALLNSNALSPNALSPNALSPSALSPSAISSNGLSPSALSPNALSPSALTAAALAAIRAPGAAGVLSRQLLSYTVSCALEPAQSFSFTWRDSANVDHPETYTGVLGLASGWAGGPLGVVGQRWVSACLAARTNWYERTVIISSRGAHPNLRTQNAQERADYLSEEGAFFGNLFLESPLIYACYKPQSQAHSRSLSRDCAAGHIDSNGNVVECGPIQILGSCADYCAPLDAGGLYYPSCGRVAGGASIVNVITTFLP